MRGSPASGKSTWIKKMGLENYTLAADNLRMLFESPILVPDKKHRVISQKNDKYVWQLLFELLERRMSKGEFIIVDATHSRTSDFGKYKKLCEKYKYRKYYIEFSDVSIEECKRRNALREDYKRVPEEVIDKMYSRLETQSKTSGWKEVDKNNFWNEVGMQLNSFSSFKRINIFGDIHGCYNPLKEYFDKFPYSEEEVYIFCGDYLDRGLQNKETLLFLIELSKKKNVLFLEGNHDKWLRYYSHSEYESIKSKTFLNKTMPQIIDVDKSDIRQFYQRLGQIAYFEFDGKKYLISHGGISYIPGELQLVATEQFINGVGDYNVQIDEIFSKNCKEVIQIHGHRNVFEVDNFENSYNLEGKVEFGGFLKALQLVKEQDPIMIKVKNDYFGKLEEINEYQECRANINSMLSILDQLRTSRDIKEVKLSDNISSFNFTRDVFHSRRWNSLTCKARGLFINTENEKVVARGYEKFFNINEIKETELEQLLTKFKDKITCYKKENGFLGIISLVNGNLFLSTKSTNEGLSANYFKRIFEESEINKEQLILYLEKNDVSLTFEVIDIENDPHIIKYNQSKIVLLDIIHNDYEFKRKDYKEVVELSKLINCECKSIYKQFNSAEEFYKWYLENTNDYDLSKEDIEGVVIESSGIMTKLKFPYYNFWKFMRRVKEQVLHGSTTELSSLYNATANYFYAWLKEQPEEVLKKDIITLREMFYDSEREN